MQRRATRLVPVLEKLDYENRLKELKLPMLSYMRMRDDMIEVYKILSDKCDFASTQLFQLRDDARTRGNSLNLYKKTKVEHKKVFIYIYNIGYLELTISENSSCSYCYSL